MAGAHCIDCGRAASIYAVQEAVYDDGICYCTSCGGLVKPDIVFFGEKLPARFHRRRACDMTQADLLIVMGTSLVVQPFAGMLGMWAGRGQSSAYCQHSLLLGHEALALSAQHCCDL